MNITIKINTDNDSFRGDFNEEAEEVARLLRDVALHFKLEGVRTRKLIDSNGNTVGKVEVAP